jgi:hypothetical protein
MKENRNEIRKCTHVSVCVVSEEWPGVTRVVCLGSFKLHQAQFWVLSALCSRGHPAHAVRGMLTIHCAICER